MLAERRGQKFVVLVRLEGVVDPLVESSNADDLGRGQRGESLFERLERSGVDLVVPGGFGDAAARADPQFAVTRIGEEIVGALVTAGRDVERGTRSVAPRSNDQHRVGSSQPVR